MRNKHAKVSDPNSFVSCPGDRERIIYSPKIGEDGVLRIVETGKEDFQSYIESFKSQTDMASILKELSLGNVDVLHQNSANYGDFTQMPKTLAEAMQLQIDAENEFYKLPLDIRNKFNNNFREWLFTAGTQEWNERMNFVSDSEEKGEPPVTEKE